jgi:hypothetical protein
MIRMKNEDIEEELNICAAKIEMSLMWKIWMSKYHEVK